MKKLSPSSISITGLPIDSVASSEKSIYDKILMSPFLSQAIRYFSSFETLMWVNAGLSPRFLL